MAGLPCADQLARCRKLLCNSDLADETGACISAARR